MKVDKRVRVVGVGGFFIFMALTFFILPSGAISAQAGPILDSNWWAALNWIKNNTAECAVVATYWDYGHFISGIADRAVVFDGASQNAWLVLPSNESDRFDVIDYDNGIVYSAIYKNGTVTRSRIKDIGTVMMTSNESLAVDILQAYAKPGCDELYFLASVDLIYKAQWWTYFAQWDIRKESPKAVPLSYSIIPLGSKKTSFQFNLVTYEYPVSGTDAFVICNDGKQFVPCTNDSVGFLRSSGQYYSFGSISGIVKMTSPDADIDGELFIVDGGAAAIFFPPQLKDSMFTKMFFYGGSGLSNFTFVGDWNNVVKLFKVPVYAR